jgi:hypothetical protein
VGSGKRGGELVGRMEDAIRCLYFFVRCMISVRFGVVYKIMDREQVWRAYGVLEDIST